MKGLESEHQLIQAAKSGQLDAFEQLILPFEKEMIALAASLAHHPDEAEDIYQEAMINTYKGLKNFRADSRFHTWMYRIVINTSSSYHRKLKRFWNNITLPQENDLSLTSDNHFYESYSPWLPDNQEQTSSDHQEDNLHLQRLNQAISHSLNSLSDRERIAFVLCHQHELKVVEAAEVMECSSGSVKSYLFRAREKMQNQLQAFRSFR